MTKRTKTLTYSGLLVAVIAVVTGLLAYSGCAKPAPQSTAPTTQAKAPAQETELQVYVPCAFQPASAKIKALFEQANPGVRVTPVVENVEVLTPKIAKGDKPDVFMCIGDKEVESLAAKDLVTYQRPMCYTTLVLIVPMSNPAKVANLEDLTKSAVKSIAVGTPNTSVGFYAQQTLENNKVWDKVKGKLVRPEYPVQLLKLASQGKVQASIAYGACFRAKEDEEKAMAAKIKLITDFQDKYCLTMACPAAVITGCQHPELAKKFVDFLSRPECQDIFADGGFMKLSDPKCFGTRSDGAPAAAPKTEAKPGAKTSAAPAAKPAAKATKTAAKPGAKATKTAAKPGAKTTCATSAKTGAKTAAKPGDKTEAAKPAST